MNYLLVLVNSEGEKVAEESLSPPRQASRMLSIAVMDELMEDSLYSYFVVATNVIGNTTSSPVAIGKIDSQNSYTFLLFDPHSHHRCQRS